MDLRDLSKEVEEERVLNYRIKFELKHNVSRINVLKTSSPYPRMEFSKIN